MANFKAPLKLHFSGESTPTTNLLVLNEVVIDRGNFLIISTEFEKKLFKMKKTRKKELHRSERWHQKNLDFFTQSNFKVLIRL